MKQKKKFKDNKYNGVQLNIYITLTEIDTNIKHYGYNIIKEEAVLLCRYFDPNATENIDFEKFLFALRGKPNASRQATIDYVYSKFDKKNVGYAEATELRKVFNCVKHPRYLSGELTEDQIFFLYLKNF